MTQKIHGQNQHNDYMINNFAGCWTYFFFYLNIYTNDVRIIIAWLIIVPVTELIFSFTYIQITFSADQSAKKQIYDDVFFRKVLMKILVDHTNRCGLNACGLAILVSLVFLYRKKQSRTNLSHLCALCFIFFTMNPPLGRKWKGVTSTVHIFQ